QVKIEHQRASGLLQQLDIPVWKWDEISMDVVTGLLGCTLVWGDAVDEDGPEATSESDSVRVHLDQLQKERAKPKRVRAMSMTIHSGIKAKILEAQSEASKNTSIPMEMLKGLDKQLERKEDGRLYLAERIWVPVYGNLRALIMNEAHAMRYFVHPGTEKMYYDLRGLYWWPKMKKDISMYVSKCFTCSKVKAEHQKPSELLQQPEIPEWKWEKITMDFINKLPRTRSGHDSI
nr:putative reverse transcriptase domain-containing protein [Tanacetum cinerariifolium]